MLDVHEHGLNVRCADNASYFTTLRANEETLDFTCLRIGGQHHVVEVRVSIRAIGLDPQAAIVVKPEAIRTVENIIVVQGDDGLTINNSFRTLLAGKDKDVPVKAGSRVIVTFFSPANDVAGGIGRVRVGGVDVVEPWLAPVRVVCQGEIDLARVGINGTPFRAVHRRSAGNIGCEAGIQQNISLVLKTVELDIADHAAFGRSNLAGEIRVVQIQRQPVTRAIVVEAGNVQGTLIQQVATGRRGVVRLRRHKLVDVLETGIVTGVTHHRLPFLRRRKDDALVTKASQRSAFLGLAFRRKRINFNHEAVGVGFVAIIICSRRSGRAHIEPHILVGRTVCQLPVVSAGAANTMSGLLARLSCVAIGKVAVPVLFRGQVGAPGRWAHRTVVQGAPGFGRVGTVGCDQLAVTTHRAANIHLGVAGNAAVEWAAEDDIPGAIGVALDMNNRYAMGGNFLANFIGRAHATIISSVGRPIGMECRLIDVLMVHHQQAFR